MVQFATPKIACATKETCRAIQATPVRVPIEVEAKQGHSKKYETTSFPAISETLTNTRNTIIVVQKGDVDFVFSELKDEGLEELNACRERASQDGYTIKTASGDVISDKESIARYEFQRNFQAEARVKSVISKFVTIHNIQANCLDKNAMLGIRNFQKDKKVRDWKTLAPECIAEAEKNHDLSSGRTREVYIEALDKSFRDNLQKELYHDFRVIHDSQEDKFKECSYYVSICAERAKADAQKSAENYKRCFELTKVSKSEAKKITDKKFASDEKFRSLNRKDYYVRLQDALFENLEKGQSLEVAIDSATKTADDWSQREFKRLDIAAQALEKARSYSVKDECVNSNTSVEQNQVEPLPTEPSVNLSQEQTLCSDSSFTQVVCPDSSAIQVECINQELPANSIQPLTSVKTPSDVQRFELRSKYKEKLYYKGVIVFLHSLKDDAEPADHVNEAEQAGYDYIKQRRRNRKVRLFKKQLNAFKGDENKQRYYANSYFLNSEKYKGKFQDYSVTPEVEDFLPILISCLSRKITRKNAELLQDKSWQEILNEALKEAADITIADIVANVKSKDIGNYYTDFLQEHALNLEQQRNISVQKAFNKAFSECIATSNEPYDQATSQAKTKAADAAMEFIKELYIEDIKEVANFNANAAAKEEIDKPVTRQVRNNFKTAFKDSFVESYVQLQTNEPELTKQQLEDKAYDFALQSAVKELTVSTSDSLNTNSDEEFIKDVISRAFAQNISSVYDQGYLQSLLLVAKSQNPRHKLAAGRLFTIMLSKLRISFANYANKIAGMPHTHRFNSNSFSIESDSGFVSLKKDDKGFYIKFGTSSYDYYPSLRLKIPRELPSCFAGVKLEKLNFRTFNLRYHHGKYKVTMTFKLDKKQESSHSNNNQAIGVDLGVVNCVTLSNGESVTLYEEFKAYKKEHDRLKAKLSRQQRGSKNYERTLHHLRRLNEHWANVRTDTWRKTVHYLVSNYRYIVIENLSPKRMAKSAKGNAKQPGSNVSQKAGLNRSILNSRWGQFFRLLAQAEEEGKCVVVKCNPQKTSITCSKCGKTNKKNRVSQSKFLCSNSDCGFKCNADLNAAKNILKLGEQQLQKQGITVSLAQTDHSNWLKNNLGKHYQRLDSK